MLSILLRKKVLQSKVISIDNYMRPNQVRSKLLKAKYHNKKLFFTNSIDQLGISQSVTSIIDDMEFLVNTLS